ncbi:aminotransferase class I/II-fold pyridoxal phosphate-dependent enzyme [Culturomica sp.]|uniref:DegT/DnrJ/EryC1/StrS family aminotransferase n=1 Tax=Culturomica sp. TaxID=1926652 RepID=UPI0003350EF3|nr:aminotransferase class I/II-fold pyridoxal phosphate-dependent enzyme [Culturomica sp.]CCZ10936.1 putative aminotransferase [Odoribacter sp. CAG:788]HBO26251.1 pyridoxal phosphate-dependent aminotransferase [Culturomica sp.]
MKSRIWLSLAHMGGREQEFIREAFDTNWVVPLGPNVDAFEKALAAYLREDKHVVALSAGTAALHLGLILLGAGVGDEVICQSFTFSASANPIMYQGAKPVFVDSEASTWNMDPVLLEEAIKDRLRKTGKLPKAIIPVHLYGMPARLDRICEIAGRYGIPVLEDAAEALGSEFKGRKCGTFGELAALSFNGNKMITTSGGGALVCRSEEEAGQVKFYATQARDAAPHYQHSHIGYNYRMSNICAGIGRGQMFVLEEHVARRRAIHALYTSLLKDIPGISVLQNPSSDFDSNFWLTCITVDPLVAGCTRENIRLALDADNIESRPLWKPMHLQPVFAEAPFYGNGTSEHLFDIGLCLPSGPTLTDEDIRRVAGVIRGLVR